jgi:nitrite reductase/ring-hydroxylating ferredoxin subunit
LPLLRICRTDEVPEGSMRKFDLVDRELLVINKDNHYYCLEERCTHAGAPLSEGSLEGEILTCPWHYSQFRITDGMVLRGPADTPLGVFEVQVKDGHLFAGLKKSKNYNER